MIFHLQKLREAKGLNRTRLGLLINPSSEPEIARSLVTKWERGERQPNWDSIEKLLVILECRLDELIEPEVAEYG